MVARASRPLTEIVARSTGRFPSAVEMAPATVPPDCADNMAGNARESAASESGPQVRGHDDFMMIIRFSAVEERQQ